MQIVILLYDRFTALDAIGPYEVLSRLPGATVVFAAGQPGLVRADTGMLALHADAALGDVPHPDIVVIPGGPGQREQMGGGGVHDWLRAADAASSWTTWEKRPPRSISSPSTYRRAAGRRCRSSDSALRSRP